MDGTEESDPVSVSPGKRPPSPKHCSRRKPPENQQPSGKRLPPPCPDAAPEQNWSLATPTIAEVNHDAQTIKRGSNRRRAERLPSTPSHYEHSVDGNVFQGSECLLKAARTLCWREEEAEEDEEEAEEDEEEWGAAVWSHSPSTGCD